MKVLTKHQVWMLARTLCFDTEDLLASVDKGIHNKTTKYGLPTY